MDMICWPFPTLGGSRTAAWMGRIAPGRTMFISKQEQVLYADNIKCKARSYSKVYQKKD
jgi:hypothetical protein